MLIGYARVSTHDQNLESQIDELIQAGCNQKYIFTDIISGATDERKGLTQAMSHIREGDTLVIWKLDRLGRSLKHLIAVVGELEEKGIGLKSIKESIDTTSSTGKLVFHLFASLAEFERELISERTTSALKAARARGRQGGRPVKFTNEKVKIAKELMENPKNSVKDVCTSLGISKATLYRKLSRSELNLG